MEGEASTLNLGIKSSRVPGSELNGWVQWGKREVLAKIAFTI